MVDRAKKISELTATDAVANSDLFVVVANAAGTGITKTANMSVIANAVGPLLASGALTRTVNTGIAYTVNGVSRSSVNLTWNNTDSFVTINGSIIISGNSTVNGLFNATSANVTLGTLGQSNAIIKVAGAVSSNISPDTPNNYYIGNTSHPWGTIWVSQIRTANLNYNDTNIVIQMAGNTASYIQSVIQNTSNAANASVNYNVSSDTANATSNYGEYGINSSTFSGSGRFSDPLAVYLAAATSNLVVGTYGSYPVNIVVNSSINWTFGTDSSLTLPSGPVIFTGNATTRAAVNTQVGTAGSNGSIYLSTAGKIYLKISATGTAATDWQRVTTTAVD